MNSSSFFLHSPSACMTSFWRIGVCFLLSLALSGHAQVKVLINPGDQAEQSRYTIFSAWKVALESALRKEKMTDVTITLSTDSTADLSATRANTQDIFVGPAHVIGSAIRYGYTPVLGLDRQVQAVLVTRQDSPYNSWEQAKGKKLGLPMQDSVVTYLVRGEVNASNTTIKGHFGELFETRYQDALLFCLHLRRCDVVAVERSTFDRWLAAGEQLKVILQSKAVPALSIAIKTKSRPGEKSLRAALGDSLEANQSYGERAKLVPLAAADFQYISTLGYFTPRTLPGATIVEVASVVRLMQSGARYIDTRNDAEFKAGHVPGARLVPYVEKSGKDADYNAAEDQFDLSKLPPDRHAALIFGCNGPECWKSFKASRAAIAAGYDQVYWFRGGFPGWRDAGHKVGTI